MKQTTDVSPFFVLTGSHPRWNFATTGRSINSAAKERLSNMQQVQALIPQFLHEAQSRQRVAANRTRQEGPLFNIGDKVWLLRHNVQTTRPCAKFDFQRLGPPAISAQINQVAYRLELPSTMRIHPVFHVWLLEPYHPNMIPGRSIPPPLAVEIDSDLEYEVNEILDFKLLRRRLYYFVDWIGYPPSKRS